VTDARLALLRELVAADEERAAGIEEVDRLLVETAAVRERSDLLAAVFAEAPSERARIDGEISEAEREVHERARALEEAAAELAAAERVGNEERLAVARRSHVHARDALSMAEKRAAARLAESRELERRLEHAECEAPAVEARAAELARLLRDRPKVAQEASRDPGAGLTGVAEWASGARAALVVARSSLSAERDALIRQATELGSVLVGEPLVATSARMIERRVEESLGG
jgi:hypothetical protein